jgi:hypothetical protein
MTRGTSPTLVFAPSFFFAGWLPSSEGTVEASVGVPLRGVGAFDMADSVPSSSSIPKDSLPLPATLRFFLNSGFGVDALYFAN